MGTNRGVVQWERGADCLTWLTPNITTPTTNTPTGNHNNKNNIFHDIFAVDFQDGSGNGSVLRFGGRPGLLITADTRAPRGSSAWTLLRVPSAITHLRCLAGGNQVLVAALRGHLGVYDMRFVRSPSRRPGGSDDDRLEDLIAGGNSHQKKTAKWLPASPPDFSDTTTNYTSPPAPAFSRSRDRNHNRRHREDGNRRRGGPGWSDNSTSSNSTTISPSSSSSSPPGAERPAEPVILFENYRNSAYIDIGFAFDAPMGLVAAAQSDGPAAGTVALYSVRTGARLRTLDFGGDSGSHVPAGHGEGSEGGARSRGSGEVIRSLQFQTFPGDLTPTLFVGAGGSGGGISAFSFGVDELGDEA